VLVVPCDMPLLGGAQLRYLADHYRPGMSALVATVGGRVHPLVGIYATDTLSALIAACKEGRLRMMDLLKDISAATLEIPADLAGEAFININTPEELLR
jgi:molybdenum cofactor guanylyltransferase